MRYWLYSLLAGTCLLVSACAAFKEAMQDPDVAQSTERIPGNLIRLVTGDLGALVPVLSDVGVVVAAMLGYKGGKKVVATVKNGKKATP